MKKIISLFQRNYDGDRLVRDEVTEGAQWVLDGEGKCTLKYDGTCCLIRNGELFKRHEIKPGGRTPELFEAATELDDVTGKIQGWLPVGDGPEDKWHREAFGHLADRSDGTYELCGPKINGNREKLMNHHLIRHGSDEILHFPRTFQGIKDAFRKFVGEGVVWHRENGDMVKIKVSDFYKGERR